MAAQFGQLLPALPAVTGAEQPGVLDSGVHQVRVVQRRLQVPDSRELPRVRCPVVPLVGAGRALVGELVIASAKNRGRGNLGLPGANYLVIAMSRPPKLATMTGC